MFIANKTINTSFRLTGLVILLFLGAASILGSGSSGDGGGTQPVITTVSPAQSSNSAVVTESITALFSIDMNGSSFDANSFTLVDNSMNPVAASSITYDAASRVVTFVPASDLISGTQYTATITTDVLNAAGGSPLASDYVWSFNVASTLVPVSVDANGVFANQQSHSASMDGTGRYAVFVSRNNFVPGISANSFEQVYLKDTFTGEVTMISTTPDGLSGGNGASGAPVISPDGRFIAFDSEAPDLIANDTNTNTRDVFLHDRQSSTTIVVSIATGGTVQGNNPSQSPSISSDGQYVVFESTASNLIGSDANGTLSDIFLHDIQTTTTSVVSVASTGSPQGNLDSYSPSISNDGRYIAFDSTASNLIGSDANGVSDVFLHDTQTTTTSIVSVASGGSPQGNNPSQSPSISGDGRYIAFESTASNLIGPDANGTISDIFLHDTTTPFPTTLISLDSGVTQGDAASIVPSISSDGLFVAFESVATNLDSADTNGSIRDIFLRDIIATTTVILSLDENGSATSTPNQSPTISANGRYIGFTAQHNLDIVNDFNSVNDIYRAHRSHQ